MPLSGGMSASTKTMPAARVLAAITGSSGPAPLCPTTIGWPVSPAIATAEPTKAAQPSDVAAGGIAGTATR